MRQKYADNLIEKLIEILKEERSRQELSHEKLAEKAGVHRTAISHLEKGIRKPTLAVFINLAAALGYSPHELLKEAEKRLNG